MRVWDLFLFEGSYVLLVIALSIFKLYEQVSTEPLHTSKPDDLMFEWLNP